MKERQKNPIGNASWVEGTMTLSAALVGLSDGLDKRSWRGVSTPSAFTVNHDGPHFSTAQGEKGKD